MLLLKFDYEVVYKQRRIHDIHDALSRFNLEEPAIGINMQLPDVGVYDTNEAEVTSKLPMAQMNWVTIEDGVILTLTPHIGSISIRPGRMRAEDLHAKGNVVHFIEGILYHQGHGNVFLVDEQEIVLQEAHEGVGGGYFGSNITSHKVL